MLLKRNVLEAVVRGDIRLAFRRWKRPTVRAGGTLRTALGVLGIDAVTPIEVETISEADAAAAGYASPAELRATLDRRPRGRVYRIELRYEGEDPRTALRARSELSDVEAGEIESRLERFDRASRRGPWTAVALDAIAASPGVRAADLAASAGFETRWFKTRVRSLKELGLTESLEVGYRLSPRGEAFLGRSAR